MVQVKLTHIKIHIFLISFFTSVNLWILQVLFSCKHWRLSFRLELIILWHFQITIFLKLKCEFFWYQIIKFNCIVFLNLRNRYIHIFIFKTRNFFLWLFKYFEIISKDKVFLCSVKLFSPFYSHWVVFFIENMKSFITQAFI